MPSIVLNPKDLDLLQQLLSCQDARFDGLKLAAAHAFPDLTDYLGDLEELVRRARDGSSYVSEDFKGFLQELDACYPVRRAIAAANNEN